jgi:hypothetical protein
VIVKTFNNKRRATVKTGTGKMRNRYCVSAVPDKAPRSAVRGVKMKAIEMHGCYTSKAAAMKAAEKLSNRPRL